MIPCGNMSESFTDALLMFVERRDVCFARVFGLSLRQRNYFKWLQINFCEIYGWTGLRGIARYEQHHFWFLSSWHSFPVLL